MRDFIYEMFNIKKDVKVKSQKLNIVFDIEKNDLLKNGSKKIYTKVNSILVGERYGWLTVIERSQNDDEWLCRCQCGEEILINSKILRHGNGRVSACKSSCIYNKKMNGRRFGSLTVVSGFQDKKIKGGKYHICRCDCGGELYLKYKELKILRDCGCGIWKRKRGHSIQHNEEMIGRVFGRLRVLKNGDKTKHGDNTYTCLCLCGNTVTVTKSNLKNNLTKSCGCQRESTIATILKQHAKKTYDAIIEYRCVNNPVTGYSLPYDIYIPCVSLFIEINGAQHYMKTPMWHGTGEDGFQNQQYKDDIKRDYALANGYLLEIDIRKYNTPELAIALLDYTIQSLTQYE